MTPKEKAKELVDKNYQIFEDDEDEHFIDTSKRISKLSALIAVDEIQKILYAQKITLNVSAYNSIDDFNHDIRYNDDCRISQIFYFDFVKKEIEKL